MQGVRQNGPVHLRRPAAAASPYVLALLLVTTGTLHLLRPAGFDGLVPPLLGDPRPWTYVSGVAELAVAAAVAVPRTRRRGGLAAAVLFLSLIHI